jgi:hypothetical protein
MTTDTIPTLTETLTTKVSSGSNGNHIGLDEADKIALGIGIPSTIFAFLTLFVTGNWWRKRKERLRRDGTATGIP